MQQYNNNNNNKSPSFLSRNIGCLRVLSTSVYQLLRTSVHSSSCPLPCLPIFCSYFSVLPLFLFPWAFQNSALFGISPSSFPNVWPIHQNFLFLIATFISSCLVTFHRSLLEIIGFSLEWRIFQTRFGDKIKTHILWILCVLDRASSW